MMIDMTIVPRIAKHTIKVTPVLLNLFVSGPPIRGPEWSMYYVQSKCHFLSSIRPSESGLEVGFVRSCVPAKFDESLELPTDPCSIFSSCHYNGLCRLHFRIEVIRGQFGRHVSSTVEDLDAFGMY